MGSESLRSRTTAARRREPGPPATLGYSGSPGHMHMYSAVSQNVSAPARPLRHRGTPTPGRQTVGEARVGDRNACALRGTVASHTVPWRAGPSPVRWAACRWGLCPGPLSTAGSLRLYMSLSGAVRSSFHSGPTSRTIAL
jgi:hypothetical protein